jgi:hypothetical protein
MWTVDNRGDIVTTRETENRMTGSQNGRGRRRSRSRYVVAGLVAAATLTSSLQAQEPETADAAQAEESLLDFSVGARLEFYGELSPGASIQATWDTPGERGSWLGLQLHGQMIQFYIDPQAPGAEKVRRDYHFASRFKAGFGRGDGPVFYGFAEVGVGVIATEPEIRRGDLYLLSGAGAGAGITLLPFTFAVEGTLGRAIRPSHDLADSFVMTLLYHFP